MDFSVGVLYDQNGGSRKKKRNPYDMHNSLEIEEYPQGRRHTNTSAAVTWLKSQVALLDTKHTQTQMNKRTNEQTNKRTNEQTDMRTYLLAYLAVAQKTGTKPW